MKGVLKYNEPLAKYTSWRVGGKANRLYLPASLGGVGYPHVYDDLCEFLATIPAEEELLWLGYGSNLLVRDGGFPGTVVLLRGTLGNIERIAPNTLRAAAGVGSAKLAHVAADHGLAGIEFLAGIPGTLGGALALNAGAFGKEIWQLVQDVLTVDRQGILHKRYPTDYQIGYRSVQRLASTCNPCIGGVGCPHIYHNNEWFVEATLKLEPDTTATIKARIRANLEIRAATQPIGLPTAGSTFRNPDGDYAGRLIEATGLKGLRQGDAEISQKHANFIVNRGHATAKDIESLMEFIKTEVTRNFGVQLVPEVHIVGVSAS